MMKKMLSSSLMQGDMISVRTRLLGKLRLVVKEVNGILCAVSENGDVSCKVSGLSHVSRAVSLNSVWVYLGKDAIDAEYVEYEEVEEKKTISLQEKFLAQ